MTIDPFSQARAAADFLVDHFGTRIDISLVLGSGWSAGANQLGEPIGDIALADVPGFSAPVVPGHGGRLALVRTASRKVAAVFTGRTHFYEGRGVDPVVHGVRTSAAWGATTLVLTNGCGALVERWRPGTVVALRDHINLTGATPLQGATFIDMTEAYSKRLRAIAAEADPSIEEGVYVQFSGPNYETPAEVRYAKIIGGDLVGMSTSLETIAAREAGLEVLGLSLVTNLGAGISETPLDHQEVIEAGRAAAPRLAALLAGIVKKL